VRLLQERKSKRWGDGLAAPAAGTALHAHAHACAGPRHACMLCAGLQRWVDQRAFLSCVRRRAAVLPRGAGK
jgi:hypothetical protein